MPYSKEKTGQLAIANHGPLVDGSPGKFDVVIVEVKSGKDNRPNSVWRAGITDPAVAYMVHFIGLHNEQQAGQVAGELATHFHYEDEKSRYRYIVVSKEPNEHYKSKGVTYISFSEIVSFIVNVRGQCWLEMGLGVASSHPQWDPVLTTVFALANDQTKSTSTRAKDIEQYLAQRGRPDS
jgi:hypothetical protein